VEQFDRAYRYLTRMRSIYEGGHADSYSRQYFEDDVLSFFVHCYHIKDWIVRLNRIGVTHKQVEDFIDSKECLKICADLCNGAKHCTLTKPPRTGRQPHVSGKQYRSSFWLSGAGGGEILRGKYSIVTATGVVDALYLAEECMRCWSTFIDQMRVLQGEGKDR
jgi:hypothetical protein